MKAVPSMGRRGCPTGGHPSVAIPSEIMKAEKSPAKNMISVMTKMVIPRTLLGRIGSRFRGGGRRSTAVMVGMWYFLVPE